MPWLILVIIAALAAAIGIFSAASKMKEHSAGLQQATREMLLRLQSIEARMETSERALIDGLTALRDEIRVSGREGREEQMKNLLTLGENQSSRLKEISSMQKDNMEAFAAQLATLTTMNESRLDAIRTSVETKLGDLQTGNEGKIERMRALVDEKLGNVETKLGAMQTSNEERLEKMRATVDEKLHATLEQRLGEAFANVSARLEQLHQGLGEMKTIASDMTSLKNVLSNVKLRGTWGEIQLGTLLEQILIKDQYEENVAVVSGRSERVEFAIKLPGTSDGRPVWLPIDSKFPQEDYLRLVAASEAGDPDAVTASRSLLAKRMIEEAQKIRTKYVEPPHTTDFAILYLPIEGLYAEVLRIDGLAERLMTECRVVPAGPTTIAAVLNSLQMGFRTLAIEKRSSEVWELLGQVKTEFGRFGGVLEKVKTKIEQAGKEIGNAGVRTRAIEKKLRNVESLPGLTELADEIAAEDEEQES